MKIITSFPRKLLNKYKKSSQSRSVSRSDHPLHSFSSTATDSSSSFSSSSISTKKGNQKITGISTPTSVLPSNEISPASDDWPVLSADVYFEIEQAFKMIDSDRDGKITRDELAAFLSRVGNEPPCTEEMGVLLGEVDRDGDGCISLEEFGAISSAFGPPACDGELREAFDFFDADHDGKITAVELFTAFKQIGNSGCSLDDCRRMINGVDKNGDGFVCFEDFCRMMYLHG